jgi:hypothetical protein
MDNAAPLEPLAKPTYINAKGAARKKMHDYILSFCDTDIQEQFKIHSFTIEPLLMQIIRDLNTLKRGI